MLLSTSLTVASSLSFFFAHFFFFKVSTIFQVNASPNGNRDDAKFNSNESVIPHINNFIFGGEQVQKNDVIFQSNVTFAENANITINNNENKSDQTSNFPNNNNDKNLVNSDNTSSVATGNSIFSKMLYNLSDFADKPSQATLEKYAFSAFERFASTLPPSTDLIPPSDDSDDYSSIEAKDPEDPYEGIFK